MEFSCVPSVENCAVLTPENATGRLCAQGMASLAEVIPQFLNPDNDVRQQAEQFFALHKANPPVFVPQLLELSRTLPEPQMRQMCAVLLRRNLDMSIWPAVGEQGQQVVKAGLLDGVIVETHDSVRKALADTITKLAAIAASSGAYCKPRLCMVASPVQISHA